MYKNPAEEIQAELADEIGMVALEYITQKLPAVLSREEMRMMLGAPDEPRDRLLLRVLYATGMRAGEAGSFRHCDVSFDNKTIFVRDGKGKKDRYVCADDETFGMLEAWCQDLPMDAEVIGMDRNDVWKVVNAAAKQTGLLDKYTAMNRRLSTHSFRHAFATHCYEGGMDLADLQLLLGHDFIETTAIYVHVGIDHVVRQYDRSHPLATESA